MSQRADTSRSVTADSAWHASEETALAQVLAGGGDPVPQLEQARALLTTCGGLDAVLGASRERLAALGLLDPQEIDLVIAVQRLVRSQPLAGRPVIGGVEALVSYLRADADRARCPETRALLLDHRSRLQADVILAKGWVPLNFDERRALVRSCIEYRASGVIVVRSPGPAELSGLHPADEARDLARYLEVLEMRLLDYVLFDVSGIHHVRWYL